MVNRTADFPILSQRSIIAYCNCQGKPAGWVEVKCRAPLEVSSLTRMTISIPNSSGNSVVLVNDKIKIEWEFDSETSCTFKVYAYLTDDAAGQNVEYGYLSKASFELTVTTQGSDSLSGYRQTYPINVLMLDKDWPYADTDILYYYAIGESDIENDIKMKFNAGALHSYNFHSLDSSDAHKLVHIINARPIPSGLQWEDKTDLQQNPGIAVARLLPVNAGTPLNPGIYPFYATAESSVTDAGGSTSGITTYFNGDYGTSIVSVCVYDPYQKGNLVLLTGQPPAQPAPDPEGLTTSEESEEGVIEPEVVYSAIPYCPGKLGDAGFNVCPYIEEEEGEDPSQMSIPHIFHSINCKTEFDPSLADHFSDGNYRVLVNGVAGNSWFRYPFLRLISLFKTGAKLTISCKRREVSSTVTSGVSSGPNQDFKLVSGNPNPTVSQLQQAPGNRIDYSSGQCNSQYEERYSKSLTAEVSGLSLSYATWTADRVLYELCNRVHDATVTGSLVWTKSYKEVRTYTGYTTSLYTPTPVGPTPQPGVNGEWVFSSGTANWYVPVSYIYENGPELPPTDKAEPTSMSWTALESTGVGSFELTSFSQSQYSRNPQGNWEFSQTVNDMDGIVLDFEEPAWPTYSFTAQGVLTVTLNGESVIKPPASGETTNTCTVTAGKGSATVTIVFVFYESGGSRATTAPASNGPVPFRSKETGNDNYSEQWSVNAATAGVTGGTPTCKGRVFFGEGRFNTNDNQSITCAGTGSLQADGNMSLPAQSLMPVGRLAQGTGGYRDRETPNSVWVYHNVDEADWNKTVVDPNYPSWNVDFTDYSDSVALSHAFTTGLLQIFFMLGASGSLSARYTYKYKLAKASGSYMEEKNSGDVSHEYAKSGNKYETKTSATGTLKTEESGGTGSDPDTVGLDVDKPSGNYYGLQGNKTSNEIEETCTMSIEVDLKEAEDLDLGLN